MLGKICHRGHDEERVETAEPEQCNDKEPSIKGTFIRGDKFKGVEFEEAGENDEARKEQQSDLGDVEDVACCVVIHPFLKHEVCADSD